MNILKTAHNSERGALLPFIILGVLIVGLVLATQSASVQQIFRSQASSSVPTVVQDLNISCSSDNSSVKISWMTNSAAEKTKIRLNNQKTPWTSDACDVQNGSNTANGNYCNDNVTEMSVMLPVTPNDSYDFWIHASNASGDSQPLHKYFSCNGTVTQQPGKVACGMPCSSNDQCNVGFVCTSIGLFGEKGCSRTQGRYDCPFVPMANPAINSFDIKSTVNASADQMKVIITGKNFGTSGTVYYSRGGVGPENETTAEVLKWTDTTIEVSRKIKDPTSPIQNTIVGGQYMRVCRTTPSGCSEYVQMPAFDTIIPSQNGGGGGSGH